MHREVLLHSLWLTQMDELFKIVNRGVGGGEIGIAEVWQRGVEEGAEPPMGEGVDGGKGSLSEVGQEEGEREEDDIQNEENIRVKFLNWLFIS